MWCVVCYSALVCVVCCVLRVVCCVVFYIYMLYSAGLNLPAKDKMVEPAFAMHWAESIPFVSSEDGKSKVTLSVREQGVCITSIIAMSCHSSDLAISLSIVNNMYCNFTLLYKCISLSNLVCSYCIALYCTHTAHHLISS